jgi:hypothetical protein
VELVELLEVFTHLFSAAVYRLDLKIELLELAEEHQLFLQGTPLGSVGTKKEQGEDKTGTLAAVAALFWRGPLVGRAAAERRVGVVGVAQSREEGEDQENWG